MTAINDAKSLKRGKLLAERLTMKRYYLKFHNLKINVLLNLIGTIAPFFSIKEFPFGLCICINSCQEIRSSANIDFEKINR